MLVDRPFKFDGRRGDSGENLRRQKGNITRTGGNIGFHRNEVTCNRGMNDECFHSIICGRRWRLSEICSSVEGYFKR